MVVWRSQIVVATLSTKVPDFGKNTHPGYRVSVPEGLSKNLNEEETDFAPRYIREEGDGVMPMVKAPRPTRSAQEARRPVGSQTALLRPKAAARAGPNSAARQGCARRRRLHQCTVPGTGTLRSQPRGSLVRGRWGWNAVMCLRAPISVMSLQERNSVMCS